MRGIVSAAAYIPRARLDRSTIAGFVGTGGGRGTRSVASYDEDTTTMGVEAARIALRSAPADVRPDALWFSTVAPAYLDKTNATAIHAALRLDHDVPAFDMGGAVRSAVGAVGTALKASGTTLVVVSDLRTGLPGSGDEANGGDAAAALLVLLTHALDKAEPNQVIALVVLADGADVLLFRTTDAVRSWEPARSVDAQVAAGIEVPYGKFLSWRGTLPVEPPRRPEPQRVSASSAGRHGDWKFGFVGGRSPDTGEPQLPPLPNSTGSVPMADVEGTIATFTVDRIAYSPSPPIVFAVVDFDGGGRLPIELTDATVEDLSMGDRVEMTFRRLFTADGIHDYFWKARPVLRSSNG